MDLIWTKDLIFFGKSTFFVCNKYHILHKLLFFSIKDQFSKGYVYYFHQMFQGAGLHISGGTFIPDLRVSK